MKASPSEIREVGALIAMVDATLPKSRHWTDISGQTFGRLQALCKASIIGGPSLWWICLCDCGKRVKATSAKLRGGRVKSCGCYRRDEFNQSRAKEVCPHCGGPKDAFRDRRRKRLAGWCRKCCAILHRKYEKRDTDRLADWYVKKKLKRQGIINPPVELIRAKRSHLLVVRTLKEKR
jgi:hypothetical protein